MKWIIVGLGNPEPEYKHTRHNAGRAVLGYIQNDYGFPDMKYTSSPDAYVSKGVIAGMDCVLVAPETFMNDSGTSVRSFVQNPDEAAQLIVMHDDIDLALGTWRLAWDRGSGGHNGVRSITTCLGTNAYIRIRVGITPVGEDGSAAKSSGAEAVLAFVLGKFTREEGEVIATIGKDISAALPILMTEGVHKAMDKFN